MSLPPLVLATDLHDEGEGLVDGADKAVDELPAVPEEIAAHRARVDGVEIDPGTLEKIEE